MIVWGIHLVKQTSFHFDEITGWADIRLVVTYLDVHKEVH